MKGGVATKKSKAAIKSGKSNLAGTVNKNSRERTGKSTLISLRIVIGNGMSERGGKRNSTDNSSNAKENKESMKNGRSAPDESSANKKKPIKDKKSSGSSSSNKEKMNGNNGGSPNTSKNTSQPATSQIKARTRR